MAKRIALILLIPLCATVVTAHDMWLESSSFLTFPGEKIRIRNGNGTIYRTSENAVAPDRIAVLLWIDPGGETFEPGTPYVEGNWLNLDFQPEKHGNYWIALASHPRKIAFSAIRQDLPSIRSETEHQPESASRTENRNPPSREPLSAAGGGPFAGPRGL